MPIYKIHTIDTPAESYRRIKRSNRRYYAALTAICVAGAYLKITEKTEEN